MHLEKGNSPNKEAQVSGTLLKTQEGWESQASQVGGPMGLMHLHQEGPGKEPIFQAPSPSSAANQPVPSVVPQHSVQVPASAQLPVSPLAW